LTIWLIFGIELTKFSTYHQCHIVWIASEVEI